jgi:hypothetical protein
MLSVRAVTPHRCLIPVLDSSTTSTLVSGLRAIYISIAGKLWPCRASRRISVASRTPAAMSSQQQLCLGHLQPRSASRDQPTSATACQDKLQQPFLLIAARSTLFNQANTILGIGKALLFIYFTCSYIIISSIIYTCS